MSVDHYRKDVKSLRIRKVLVRWHVHRFRVPPEPLKVIERAGACRKNVDQEIAVVHKNPFAAVVALNADGAFAHRLQSRFNLVTNGVALPGIGYRTHDKIIGERGNFF
jgi:hypothetical protein